jgi:hypothetical protein
MGKITRRTFVSQTASMALGASALATEVPALPQPATTASDVMAKRRETLEVLLKILPRRKVETQWKDQRLRQVVGRLATAHRRAAAGFR